MQLFKHGVLLGTLLIVGLLSEQIISKAPDLYCTVQISESDTLSWSDNFSFSCQSSSYPANCVVHSDVPVSMLDVARANIDKNSFCQKRYVLSSTEANNLLRLQYAHIVAALLKLDHLTDYGTYELWSLYRDRCWKFWKVNECERELKQRLQERAVKREQQKLQKKEEEKRQRLLIQKQKEQFVLRQDCGGQGRNQKVYHTDLLHSDYPSPYYDARKQALAKTQKDHCQRYEQCRELDVQTIGLCVAHNIDYQKLQQCTGTAMQHQLYDEVADCYKKIAKFFCQPTLGQTVLAQQSLEFAQCVIGATELEAMELAIALSDLAHGCTDLACWVVSESQEALHDFVHNITDPIGSAYKVFEMAKSAGIALGKVMNYVAEAMVHADSESLGWSHYAQVLEQEHQYDAEYAQQVIDGIKSWVVHSSAQDKVRMVTRGIVDGILYGNLCKVLSQAGKACCGLIADIPEFRLLEEVTEYGLMTETGEIGLQGMEDLGMSLLKSEVDIARRNKLIKNGIKNSSSNLVEAERQIVQLSLETRTIHEVLDELRKYGARSKIFQKEVKAYFNELFYKNELLKLYTDFKNPLCMELMNHEKKVKLVCDLEHLMTYNLKFRPNKETGLIEGFLSGGHIGKYRKSLEKTKDIIIVSERELHGGVRAIEYRHKFGSFIEQKTEYPLHWTAQDIVESIQSAWQNQVYSEYDNGLWQIIGFGKDDVRIHMYIKKLSDGALRLKTAYPYCKEFSRVQL